MDPRRTDPSNIQISTSSLGGALQLTGGNLYFTNSTRILYRPSQTFWMILLPLLLVGSDAANSGTFASPHLIFVDIPQIM